MSRNYQNHFELYPDVAAQDPDVHYLIEKQISGPHWELVEAFEDLGLADRELGLLQTRWNHNFRIVKSTD